MLTDLEKYEFVECFSFSTSLCGLGLYYFASAFSHLPPTPSKKTKKQSKPPQNLQNYGGFPVGWNGNFSACHSKLFTSQPPTHFQFYLLGFPSVHILSSPQGFSLLPSTPCVFTPLPLCSGCSLGLGCPFSYPVYLTNPCPFLKIQLKCCLHKSLCIFFSDRYLPPLCSHI